MDKLWAPWRINYVSSARKSSRKKNEKCLFCRLLKARSDRKNLIVTRTDLSFSILNAYPYNNGHVMVAPLRHVADISDLKEQEALDLFNLLLESKAILAKVLKPQGYNVGINLGKISGAGVDKHLHIHIVPRWLGDTNFMPTVASAKVISQSLEELYKKLKKHGKKK